MNKMPYTVSFVLLALFFVIIIFMSQGLIYWGIGAFVCWAFNISFEWTFVHGLALAFVVSILASIFSRKNS